jgi:hypothetical protein
LAHFVQVLPVEFARQVRSLRQVPETLRVCLVRQVLSDLMQSVLCCPQPAEPRPPASLQEPSAPLAD